MKTVKTGAIKLLALLAIVSILSSCLTTKTQVGDYREAQGNEYTYDKAKQVWLFWGLIAVGRASADTPSSGSCEVVTKFTFVDVLISGITGGIVTTYTIKVNAKK